MDDDAGYVAWLAAHPGGYVLNHERYPSIRYLVLHRAACATMAPRDGGDTRTWTSAYPKTCAPTSAALADWAEASTGGLPATAGPASLKMKSQDLRPHRCRSVLSRSGPPVMFCTADLFPPPRCRRARLEREVTLKQTPLLDV